MFFKGLSTASLAFAALVSAQTYTECNPLKKTCPADPALGGTISIDFTKGESSFFTGTALKYDPALGAVFTINNENDSPTLTSKKYIFFGKVEVELQASVGVGVVTSLVLQSDDLDEIDWEWLGGDFAQVQTNYFSKGDTTTYDRGKNAAIANPQTSFHTYTIDWTPSVLTWSIDGTVVRTLNFADAKGTSAYPQTPMQVKLGTWVAGSKKNAQGTIDWAGGLTDFSKAPFLGYYRKVTITDYSNGVKGATSYTYGDQSGTYQSIKVLTGGQVAQGEAVSSSTSSGPTTTAASSTSKSSSTESKPTTMTTATSANSTGSTTKTTSTSGTTTGTNAAATTTAPNAAVKAGSSMSALVLAAVFAFGMFAM